MFIFKQSQATGLPMLPVLMLSKANHILTPDLYTETSVVLILSSQFGKTNEYLSLNVELFLYM